MESKAKVRCADIDIAKGFAILCVMISHMYGGYVHQFLFSFEIPLFFFLSGYFLSDKQSLSVYAKKRFSQIIVPYLTVISIIAAYRIFTLFLSHKENIFAILHIIVEILKGTPGYGSVGPFWFLPALFFAALVTKWAISSRYTLIYISLALLMGIVASRYISPHITPPFSLQYSMKSALFVYFGYWYKNNINTTSLFSEWYKMPVLLVIWIIGALGFANGTSVPDSIPGIMGAAAAIPVCLFLSQLGSKVKWISMPMSFIGRHTLLLLSIHCLDQQIGLIRMAPIPYSTHMPVRITFTIVISVLLLAAKYFIQLIHNSWKQHNIQA